jgi:hypothetical protein
VATAAGHRPSHLRRPRPAVALVPDPDSAASHTLPCRGGRCGPTPCPHRWPTCGRRPDTVRASERRGHRHGHRHQPAIVCRTPAVRRVVARAAVPEAADGQSAARSGSFRLPPPCLKARLTCDEPTLQEPTSPAVPSGPAGGAAARLRRHGHQFRRPWPRSLSIMARLVEAAEGSRTPLLRRPVAPQPGCRRRRRQLRRMRG